MFSSARMLAPIRRFVIRSQHPELHNWMEKRHLSQKRPKQTFSGETEDWVGFVLRREERRKDKWFFCCKIIRFRCELLCNRDPLVSQDTSLWGHGQSQSAADQYLRRKRSLLSWLETRRWLALGERGEPGEYVHDTPELTRAGGGSRFIGTRAAELVVGVDTERGRGHWVLNTG